MICLHFLFCFRAYEPYLLWTVPSVTTLLLRFSSCLCTYIPKSYRLLNCSALRSISITEIFSLLWLLLTSHSSLLLQISLSVRPHGINQYSFFVYLLGLHNRFTVTFGTSLRLAHLSAMQALVLGFCSSGYDFAIASSRPHLTMWTLQVAIGFAGNYAPCGLSPQTNGMPVILKKQWP